MKNFNGKLVFHPMLPAYLIYDLVEEYRQSKEKQHLRDAQKILDLSIAHSSHLKNSIVFYYYPKDKLTLYPNKFYSALTQIRYLRALCHLNKHSEKNYIKKLIIKVFLKKYSEKNYLQQSIIKIFNLENIFKRETLIKKIFNSLLIDVQDGGVLLNHDEGIIFEEYPHSIPQLTLNGWLTVIQTLIEMKSELKKLNIGITELIDKNLMLLKKILPLYDVPHLHNSRYQLTGFNRLRLILSKETNLKFKKIALKIPSLGCYGFKKRTPKNTTRWHNYVEKNEGKLIQLNIVQSLISYPKPNILEIEILASEKLKFFVQLGDGDYTPDLSGMPLQRWRVIGNFFLNKGLNKISIPLPFDDKNITFYPTNFKKRFNSKQYNVYHFIHIAALADLYAFSNDSLFKEYALKWLEYSKKWSSLDIYKDCEHTHPRTIQFEHKVLQKLEKIK